MTMNPLVQHTTGDATAPVTKLPAAIIHVTNDIGAWGAGFVIAVSRRWHEPEIAYRESARAGKLLLGTNQVIEVEDGLYVVNMTAQRGVSRSVRAVSYDALDECLHDLFDVVVPKLNIKSVHAPLIGAGLGGGNWDIIESMLDTWATVPTIVYHLPNDGHRVDL